MIVIKPYGGLGNRLRSLDSAIALSDCTRHSLKMIWDANEELNCSFSSLFNAPEDFDLKEISTSYLSRKFQEKIAIIFHFTGINYPFSFDCVLHENDLMKLKSRGYDFCKLKNFKNIYINSNGRFLSPGKPYNYLSPVSDIKQKVDELCIDFDDNCIGVHIRRTDNQLSIKKSPIEKFIELMKAEEKQNPEQKFFLSTDSPRAENDIEKAFKGKIIKYDKELSRKKEQGVKDALIDMLCLSRTSKIIGSYWSSFSEVAAEMGNIPLVIAANET